MSPFAWSFAAGLIVIFLFAWDQFNLKSWKAQKKFALMLSVLNPADLRGGAALRRAFLIYATILSLVYAGAVFLLSMGVIAFDPAIGGFAPGTTGGGNLPPAASGATVTSGGAEKAAVGGTAGGTRPEPWVPLAISLAMVGLAPRTPGFARGEERLRALTHALMGIPSALNSASRDIALAPLSLQQIGEDWVANEQRVEIRRYLDAAELALGKGAWSARLEKSLMKILAFRVWVLDQEIFPDTGVRERYALIEEDVTAALAGMFEDLDDLAGQTLAEPQPIAEAKRLTLVKRWESRIRATGDLSDDVCALMYVYFEKSRGKAGDGAVMDYLKDVLRTEHAVVDQLNMLLTSVMAAVGIAFAWGYAQGRYLWIDFRHDQALGLATTAPNYGASQSALLFALTAFFTYGPATLSAIWWRGAHEDGGGRARRSGEAPVFPALRLLTLFLASAGITLAALVVLNVANSINAVGLEKVADNLRAVLIWAFRSELPYCVLGGLQGVFIARMLDLDRESLLGAPGWRLLLLHGVALMAWGALVVDLTSSGEASLRDFLLAAPVAGVIGWVSSWTLLSSMRRAIALERPEHAAAAEPAPGAAS
ncbi:hypothetical protein [Tropicimonas sp. IMCC34043]|uniref:hypothetical protein n=1 Tax=Tropicimonas sp. IMCC34043 TaxID=2248760 RepID=UPI000E26D888|nr:hypothetical protein [Tropicimonas sp. IMCC34043]